MSGALDLQAALIALLRGDATLAGLLGDGLIEDGPRRAASFPHVATGEWTATPLDAEGGGTQHRMELLVWSRAGGRAETLQILARIDELAASLDLADPRLVSIATLSQRVTRGRDGRSWRGAIVFRAVTEPA